MNEQGTRTYAAPTGGKADAATGKASGKHLGITAPLFPQRYSTLPCVADPELFQPGGYGTEYNNQIAEAKAICRLCPALRECREWAVEAHEPFGIWAGTTPEDRKKIRKARGLPAVRATHHGYFDEKGHRVDKHGRRVS